MEISDICEVDKFNNISKIEKDLELEELEAPNAIPSPSLYLKLLAIYLFQNELCEAKFLWKRIPSDVKESTSELAHVWEVGKCLWRKDSSAVYQALSYDWSDVIQPIMNALEDKYRKKMLLLVSKAYSSIEASDLSVLLGMNIEQTVQAIHDLGWRMDSSMVFPREQITFPQGGSSIPDHLPQLTQFVSFLENL